MKFLRVILASAFLAISFLAFQSAASAVQGVEVCVAASQDASQYAKIMADAFNSPEVSKMMVEQSQGTIDLCKASAEGNTVVVTIRFAKPMNFDQLSSAEKKEVLDSLTNEFITGMGSEAFSAVKAMGLTFTFKFTDHFSHTLTRSI